jgi:pyridoxal phosphate enzyme (YggS family)
MSDAAELLQRLATVREAIARACAARVSGHGPPGVTLVAASKRQPIARLITLFDAGVHDFGENYVQELEHKAEALARTGRMARWHLIGPLQRNKAAKVVPHVHSIHTVSSVALIDALHSACARSTRTTPLPVLLQVRLSADTSRAGLDPDDFEGLVALGTRVANDERVQLTGLMGLPPASVPPEPYFARLRALQERLQVRAEFAACTELSMGMTHDFRAAIHQGATMVRIGSGLFGPRS